MLPSDGDILRIYEIPAVLRKIRMQSLMKPIAVGKWSKNTLNLANMRFTGLKQCFLSEIHHMKVGYN